MSSTLSDLVFSNADAFGDADDVMVAGDDSIKATGGSKQSSYVHIRIQQRNGRKSLTTVQGLASDLDLRKILKALKKTYSTNGTILTDDELGQIIQLQGDQRKNVYDFLTRCNICGKTEVKIHGF